MKTLLFLLFLGDHPNIIYYAIVIVLLLLPWKKLSSLRKEKVRDKTRPHAERDIPKKSLKELPSDSTFVVVSINEENLPIGQLTADNTYERASGKEAPCFVLTGLNGEIKLKLNETYRASVLLEELKTLTE